MDAGIQDAKEQGERSQELGARSQESEYRSQKSEPPKTKQVQSTCPQKKQQQEILLLPKGDCLRSADSRLQKTLKSGLRSAGSLRKGVSSQ